MPGASRRGIVEQRTIEIPRSRSYLLGGLGLAASGGGAVAVFLGEGDAAAAALVTVGLALVAFALVIPYIASFKGGGIEVELRAWDKLTENFQTADPTYPKALEKGPAGIAQQIDIGDEPNVATTGPQAGVTFTPDNLDALLLALHGQQLGLFLGHVVSPEAMKKNVWEVAIFVTGWGPLEDVARAEFYFGRAWDRKIFTSVPDADGKVGIVVRVNNGFVALCRVTLSDGREVFLNHYCNLGPGEGIGDEPFRRLMHGNR